MKNMAFNKKINYVERKTNSNEKCVILNFYQETETDMKNEQSVNSICDILNNLLTDSGKVLHLLENMTELAGNVTKLDFTKNNFEDFIEYLSMFKCLEKLLICNNILQSLPDSIGELNNLRILNISHNQLTDLPLSLRNLNNLVSLDVSYNQLENLPIEFFKLQRLKELDISNNKFRTLPDCITTGMGTLRILNVSFNPRIKMNIEPYSRYLEKFIATNNKQCLHFPDWITKQKFCNLNEVILDETTFDLFSIMEMDGTSNIKILSITCSNLSNLILNKIVESMVRLEIINTGNRNSFIPGNVFSNIPIKILKDPQLISAINFRGTGLSIIPAEIKLLCNLKILDLGSNSISWFPDEFCELYKLESLKIDENNCIMFPTNIGNMKSLHVLRAQHNCLSRLPKSFQYLENLIFIDFYDNCFDQFPPELFKINNLQGLDFEQNFVGTNNMKIRGILYSTLREKFFVYIKAEDKFQDNRNSGIKSTDSSSSEEFDNYEKYNTDSSEEDKGNMVEVTTIQDEENWDTTSDSDDEFDPTNHAMKIYEYSKQLLPVEINNFCPADLHSKNITSKVASMNKCGSLPLFEIQEGQFDDD